MPDLINEVIGEYLKSSNDWVNKLCGALIKADIDTAMSAAHGLRSCSCMVGANELARITVTMENLIVNEDLASALELKDQLLIEHLRVIEALTIYMNSDAAESQADGNSARMEPGITA
jgi:HPt (histidine-containing phosphotransfer) domain-containing protein